MKIFIFLLLFPIYSAFAWGPLGHRIVAQIAHTQLDEDTLNKIQAILGNEQLVDVANWPDEIRSDPNWKKANPWHYVSIEDGKTYANTKKVPEGDILNQIDIFTKELKNPKANLENKKVALKFLVHLIGDLHMPLHVGRKKDQGGNLIKLKWFDKKTNLHEIWDVLLIEMEKLSFTEYAQMLVRLNHVSENESKQLNPIVWAQESQDYRQSVYDFPKNQKKYWEYNYRFKVKSILNQRLYLGGKRLAYWLKANL